MNFKFLDSQCSINHSKASSLSDDGISSVSWSDIKKGFLLSFLQNPLKSGIFAFHPLCGGCGFRVQSDKVEFVAIQ